MMTLSCDTADCAARAETTYSPSRRAQITLVSCAACGVVDEELAVTNDMHMDAGPKHTFDIEFICQRRRALPAS